MKHEYLKECISYNPYTGEMLWLERPLSHFKSSRDRKAWNKRFSGNRAGHVKKTCGYTVVCIDDFRHQAHRLAWFYVTGSEPENHIDHINHERTDNRMVNLRIAGHAINAKNQSKRADNSSGVCGVHWRKDAKKWSARITLNKNRVSLGLFEILDDAKIAVEKAYKANGYHPNHGK